LILDSGNLTWETGYNQGFSASVFEYLSIDFLLNLRASDFLLLLLDRPFGLELRFDLLFYLLLYSCSFEFLARFAKFRLPEIDAVFIGFGGLIGSAASFSLGALIK